MECINCNHPLQNKEKFCPNCGNPILCERISVRSLINEFFSKYLSVDSKFFVTIKDMTVRPEKVIKSYIENNRAKYLPPINFMIIAGLFGGFFAYLMNNGYLGEIDYSIFAPPIEEQKENPISPNQEELSRTINNEIQKYYSIVLFLTIPLLALISKLVFHNYKRYNFAEHSVIYAYSYSQYLVLSYVAIPFCLIFDGFLYYYTISSFVLIIAFHSFVLKRFFEISWLRILVKTLFFLVIITVVMLILFIVGVIATLVYLVVTGKIDQFSQA